jgi:hypothetical protein
LQGPALTFSLLVDRQRGENQNSHFKKPQAIVALLFDVCAVAGFLRAVYILSAKRNQAIAQVTDRKNNFPVGNE